jgi:hypothetical protein
MAIFVQYVNVSYSTRSALKPLYYLHSNVLFLHIPTAVPYSILEQQQVNKSLQNFFNVTVNVFIFTINKISDNFFTLAWHSEFGNPQENKREISVFGMKMEDEADL